jgi:SpoIID/LytB domain protein
MIEQGWGGGKMIKLAPVLLGIVLFTGSNAHASPLDTLTPIRVKIYPHLTDYGPAKQDLDSTQVGLMSASACKVYYGETDQPASTGTLYTTESTVTLNGATLTKPLWIDCPAIVQVYRGDPTKIQSYSYEGPIYAHAIDNPRSTTSNPLPKVVELIDVISVETYLRGVVATEMPHTWPAEALKAQAVAARTYALFHETLAQALGNAFYDVDDTVFYQAFTGASGATAESDAAIVATVNQVITYQGTVIQAFFSADSGGYTEDASSVWPVNAPYCQSKKEIYVDPGLDGGAYGPWTVTVSLSELSSKLIAARMLPNSNPVTTISIPDNLRDASGRAQFVHLTLYDGSQTNLTSLDFQNVFGLRSTFFTVTQNVTGQIEFDGKGFGHGVGMSQYGAQVLAQVYSYTYQQIVMFYYTGVLLTNTPN